MKCEIVVGQDGEHSIQCGKEKDTRLIRVAGGIGDTMLPVYSSHEVMLRRTKPHWQLWPQPKTST